MSENITSEMLESLREKLIEDKEKGRMSEKRLVHTLEVEKMAAKLAKIYLPEKENILRAAALLHDTTKEYSFNMQIKVCAEYNINLTRTDVYAPKTLHARTGAALIERDFPKFNTEEIKSCVRWHTTGREGMTLSEKIIYLADYIDMSRTYEGCVKLRNYFFSKDTSLMSEEERLYHLDDTIILSLQMTVGELLQSGTPISPDTIGALNELIINRKNRK